MASISRPGPLPSCENSLFASRRNHLVLDISRAQGDHFSNDFRPVRLRHALVVCQVTVCLLLLVCAGVLLRAARKVEDLDTGLVTRGAFHIEVDPKYQSKIVDRLKSEPNLESLAAAWPRSFMAALEQAAPDAALIHAWTCSSRARLTCFGSARGFRLFSEAWRWC